MNPTDIEMAPEIQKDFTEVEQEMTALAKALVKAEIHIKEKYFILCKHIRSEELNPVQVTRCLAAAGLSKERISEIKRVCFTSTPIFNEYLSHKTTFRIALGKARSGARLTERQRAKNFILAARRFVKNYDGNIWEVTETHCIFTHLLPPPGQSISYAPKGYEITVVNNNKPKHNKETKENESKNTN